MSGAMTSESPITVALTAEQIAAIRESLARQGEPMLGLASTRDLLGELAARMENTQNSTAGRDLARRCRDAIDKLARGVLDYRTVSRDEGANSGG